MILFLIWLINFLTQVLTWLIIVDVVLSYFMSPFHPIRQSLDRIVNPLLLPIRKVVPLVGMIDFSPLILLILVQFVGSILKNLLISLL
ncbi:MAG TPA: YggT family protein [Anaerolineae bacterium]|nr:YggT family protein [Anaerolineae bacterium]